MEINFEEIGIELLDHMGDDLAIANAARVSFHKESEEFSFKDEGLIAFLARHNHTTPFRHTAIKLRCKVPFALARQLGKHQVGLSWNEVSRRYVSTTPTIWLPKELHCYTKDKKQGCGNVLVDYEKQLELIKSHSVNSIVLYQSLLDAGVAPEETRLVLPQNIMTEFIWTGSLLAFAEVYKQRIDAHAQGFAREFADKLAIVVEPLFPVAWKAITTKE